MAARLQNSEFFHKIPDFHTYVAASTIFGFLLKPLFPSFCPPAAAEALQILFIIPPFCVF